MTVTVVDLETTGLDRRLDGILWVGAVKLEDGEIIDTFSEKVGYDGCVPAAVTKLTGLKTEDFRGCAPVGEVLKRFLEFAGRNPIVGYNLSFDYDFIQRECPEITLNGARVGLDMLKVCRTRLKGLRNYKLATVFESLGCDMNVVYDVAAGVTMHGALVDAVCTALVYLKCGVGETFVPLHDGVQRGSVSEEMEVLAFE